MKEPIKVIKRNGEQEKFNIKKVVSAVNRAYRSCKVTLTEDKLEELKQRFDDVCVEAVHVDDIHKLVEKFLNKYDPEVAKKYVSNRRDHTSDKDFVKRKIGFINKYKNSDNTANATVDDNSNVGGKNIGVLNAEIHKEDNIKVSRGMMLQKLEELFPDFDNKQYIADLESHVCYKHDESSFSGAIAPYCCSISMYPFLTDGIKKIGGLSAKPRNLDSFCGMYVNLIFAVSAQFAGAVATSEYLLYFDYYSRKEWGNDYYLHTDTIITANSNRKLSIKQKIHQHHQQVIYTLGQPSGSRGLQSAFVNFSYFDKPFFEGMFGEFYFPDGTKPVWESLCWLQKDFMMWFNEEREKCMLTFPVESFALVYKDGEFVDKESAEFVAEEYARGHSFFTYISDTVDSLSSCCFIGDTKISYKINKDSELISESFEDVYKHCLEKNIYVQQINPYTFKEEWEEANVIETVSNNIFKLTLSDGFKINCTSDHIFPIEGKGNVEAEYLKPGDVFISTSNSQIKLISIEEITCPQGEKVYCIQFKKGSPYFKLSNGVITHNCRLKNKIQTKEFNFTNGNMGVNLGPLCA